VYDVAVCRDDGGRGQVLSTADSRFNEIVKLSSTRDSVGMQTAVGTKAVDISHR